MNVLFLMLSLHPYGFLIISIEICYTFVTLLSIIMEIADVVFLCIISFIVFIQPSIHSIEHDVLIGPDGTRCNHVYPVND